MDVAAFVRRWNGFTWNEAKLQWSDVDQFPIQGTGDIESGRTETQRTQRGDFYF